MCVILFWFCIQRVDLQRTVVLVLVLLFIGNNYGFDSAALESKDC